MSLLLIMLGAGLVFSLTGRGGAALSQTQSALFVLPPAIVNSFSALGIRVLRAASPALKASVSTGHSGTAETVGLP